MPDSSPANKISRKGRKEHMYSIIWTMEVYERNFRCNNCGIKLWDEENNKPMKFLEFVPYKGDDSKVLVCARCGNAVGVLSRRKNKDGGAEWKGPVFPELYPDDDDEGDVNG